MSCLCPLSYVYVWIVIVCRGCVFVVLCVRVRGSVVVGMLLHPPVHHLSIHKTTIPRHNPRRLLAVWKMGYSASDMVGTLFKVRPCIFGVDQKRTRLSYFVESDTCNLHTEQVCRNHATMDEGIKLQFIRVRNFSFFIHALAHRPPPVHSHPPTHDSTPID